MKILNEGQITQKIKRLAIEILENNFNEKQIILAGINNNGLHFAGMLQSAISNITEIPIKLTTIKLNPADPLASEITIGLAPRELKRKNVIIVDDVANTGRTLFFAMKPLLEILPRKVEVAVLVDRKHKSFPILADYVGLSLATTLKDNIDVRINEVEEMAVFLD